MDESVAADERDYAADSVANVLVMLLVYSELGLEGLMSIPTAMLLSTTPVGEIAAIPPMTAVER